MVGSLLFLGVSPVVALVTSRFVRTSIGIRFVWIDGKRRVEFCELLEFQSTVSTTSASGLCSPYQAMPLNPDGEEIRIRFGTSRNPSHGQKAGKKASKIDLFQQNIFCMLDCVICGDFYYYQCLSPPHETALANTTGTF